MFRKSLAVFGVLIAAGVSSQTSAVTTIPAEIFSNAMQKSIRYRVVLPAAYNDPANATKTFPVMYCLHGRGANEEPFTVMNPLNNAIDSKYPTVLVTFYAEDSFYIDSPTDASVKYTTFFFDELVPFIESTYRAGGKKGLRAVTGFSMGGYGSWHYMLEKPDFFSSVSALSGAFNREFDGQFNPYTIIPAYAAQKVALPPTYMNCGTSDSLIGDSRNMKALLESNGYTTTLVETPGAGHTWQFWRDASDELIAWHFPHFTDAETWAGLTVVNDSVNTGSWMGWLNVKFSPWVWSYDMKSWVYLPEPSEVPSGAWAFVL